MHDNKQLKFRATIIEERDEWFDAINELMKFTGRETAIEIVEVFYQDVKIIKKNT